MPPGNQEPALATDLAHGHPVPSGHIATSQRYISNRSQGRAVPTSATCPGNAEQAASVFITNPRRLRLLTCRQNCGPFVGHDARRRTREADPTVELEARMPTQRARSPQFHFPVELVTCCVIAVAIMIGQAQSILAHPAKDTRHSKRQASSPRLRLGFRQCQIAISLPDSLAARQFQALTIAPTWIQPCTLVVVVPCVLAESLAARGLQVWSRDSVSSSGNPSADVP